MHTHFLKYIGLVIVTMLVSAWQTYAQDPQFSQYYASPLYMNPGFTGTTEAQRIVSNNRLQWTELKSPFITNAVSYDVNVDRLNSGFGLIATTDKAGSANLRTTSIGALYAAKIRLSKKWMISPGLNFTYGSRGVDFDKLVFGDQIEYNGPTTDEAIAQLGNRNYFDFSSGVVLYNSKFWIGYSAHHINTPNHSLLGEDAQLPMKTSIHAGMNIPIQLHPLSKAKLSGIMPSAVYSRQGEFQQVDLGVNLVYDPILFGLWYRGMPIERNSGDKINHDALIFILGMNLKYIEIGYSYDLTISAIGPQSGGSHELSIVFEFEGFGNPNKVKRKDKYLPCPNTPHFQGYSSSYSK